MKEEKILVIASGASGMIYLDRFLYRLVDTSYDLIASTNATYIYKDEIGGPLKPDFSNNDFYSSPASSSTWLYKYVVVLPCSVGFLGRVASGFSSTLAERAVDVALKESIPIIMCLRETPLNAIHLENLLKLSRLGIKILPLCPGFYNKPKNFNDLADNIVDKLIYIVSAKV